MTLEEAASFSIEREVRVYGIEPGGAFSFGAEIDDLRTQLRRTGGEVFSLDDASGGQSIVDEVLDDQATTLEGVPELVVTDHPGWPFRIGVFALWLVVFLAWRSRL